MRAQRAKLPRRQTPTHIACCLPFTSKRNDMSRPGKPSRLFACSLICTQRTTPAWAHRGRSCRTPGWWGLGSPADVLALRYELGGLFAAIFLGLLQALILSLRIAHGFGQHLAQLRLGLCWFAFSWLPLGHVNHMGSTRRELNPHSLSASCPVLPAGQAQR